MKKWSSDEGIKFQNSDLCYGWEYQPSSGKMDIAKIMIRGEFPEDKKWGYLEESYEMATVIRGEGYVETKKGEHYELKEGDVVYVEPMERFRWGGDMDLIIPCAPAFDPKKHKVED